MNKAYIVTKCERCGNESRLMIHSVRSNIILCPVCQENEVECRLISPEMKVYNEYAGSVRALYPYTTGSITLSAN